MQREAADWHQVREGREPEVAIMCASKRPGVAARRRQVDVAAALRFALPNAGPVVSETNPT